MFIPQSWLVQMPLWNKPSHPGITNAGYEFTFYNIIIRAKSGDWNYN